MLQGEQREKEGKEILRRLALYTHMVIECRHWDKLGESLLIGQIMTVQKIFGSLSIFVVEVRTWPMACITLVIAAPPHSLAYAREKNK